MGTDRETPVKEPWAKQAHELIAELVQETWKLQNALSEGNGPTLEIEARARQIEKISRSVNGHIARWALWGKETP